MAILVLGSLGHSPSATAQEWGKVGFISSTLGNTLNRVCVGAPSALRPGDLGCSSVAPYVSPTSGNLGINSTNPTSKLSVVGSGFFKTNAVDNAGALIIDQSGTSGAARFHLYDGPGNIKLLLTGNGTNFFNSGNVGIGTTAPQSTLQVSGSFVVSTSAQTTTPSLYVGTNGNVGVGTTTPTQALDVNGNVALAHNGILSTKTGRLVLSPFTGELWFGVVGGAGMRTANNMGLASNVKLAWSDSVNNFYNATQDLGLSRTSSGVLEINNATSGQYRDLWARTVSATNFVGDGSGLTGITADATDRITSGTTQLLVVSDTGYISLTQAGSNTGWFSPYTGLVTLGVSSTGGISGTSGYFTGYVGVGTNAPEHALEVNGGVKFKNYAQGNDNGGPYIRGVAISAGSPPYSFIGSTDTGMFAVGSNGLGFSTDGYERMRILGSGNVGIRTTAPQATLQVSGSFVVSTSAQTTTPSLYVGVDGNVGVGTNNPGYKLDVRGGGNFTSSVYLPGSGVSLIFGSGTGIGGYTSGPLVFQTNGSENVRINTGGNVGIGTTAPSNTLHVSGTARITSWTTIAANVTPTVELDVYGTISATNLLVNGVAVGGSIDRITSGTTNITAHENTSLTFTTAGSQRMVIDERGYVGIGTTAPTAKLMVAGEYLTLSGASADGGLNTGWAILSVRNHNSQTAMQLGMKGYMASAFLQLPSFAPDFRFLKADGTSAIMTLVSSSGNVGIGTTNPQATLQVSGSFVVSTSAQVTTPSLYVGTNGYVGVGTSAPVAKLDVTDYYSWRVDPGQFGGVRAFYGAEASPRFDFGPKVIQNTSPGIGWRTSGASIEGTGAAIGHPAGRVLAFYTSNATALTERMRVDASGNVGIGTTTPSSTLHVSGTARITSNTEVSGTIKIAATGSEVCDAASTGTIRYDQATGRLQICRE